MLEFVIKHSGGLIKNEQQAQYVLLGFVVLAIAVSLFLLAGGGSEPKIVPSPVGDDPLYYRK